MKAVLFDFDGVLADSFDAALRVANRLAPEFGYTPPGEKEVAAWRDRSAKEIIQLSGIPVKKIPPWLRKFKVELAHEIPIMRPFPGMGTTLAQIRKEGGRRIGILSSNSEENVAQFLENNGWKSFFDFIYSSSTLFGKSRILNKILKKEDLTPGEVLYVADEIRDIEAARKSRVRSVAVSWGFSSRQGLIMAHPDFIIDRPEQLLGILRQAEAS